MAIDDPNPLLSLWWKLPGMKSRPEPDSGEMSTGIIIPFQGPRQGILRVLIPRGFMGFWWWTHFLWVFMFFFIIWKKIRSTRKLSLGPKKTCFSHRKKINEATRNPPAVRWRLRHLHTTSPPPPPDIAKQMKQAPEGTRLQLWWHQSIPTWHGAAGSTSCGKWSNSIISPMIFPMENLQILGSLFLEKAISKTKKTASDTRKSGF